ncbi:MAG TPA: 30S ribosomal protein S19e [Candidatus Nanoarchaeia archaeon]|nr:30S ribosomal protein S19e [Candidatus Nanoarchaeia archaeon]
MRYDVPQSQLVKSLSVKLRQELKMPSWAMFVKTGVHKERPPTQTDWWYMRAASMLRKIDRLGPVGVSKLSRKYGGKKNRGMEPEKFKTASGKVIRTILQQLEQAQLVKNLQQGIHKGRVLTKKGLTYIEEAAGKKEA